MVAFILPSLEPALTIELEFTEAYEAQGNDTRNCEATARVLEVTCDKHPDIVVTSDCRFSSQCTTDDRGDETCKETSKTNRTVYAWDSARKTYSAGK